MLKKDFKKIAEVENIVISFFQPRETCEKGGGKYFRISANGQDIEFCVYGEVKDENMIIRRVIENIVVDDTFLKLRKESSGGE